MSAVASAPAAETKIAMSNIPWSGYETLLGAHLDQPGIRFFYNDGELEIMTVSFAHEEPARLLAQVVEILAEEFDMNVRNVGSATFKREALGKGFEPDQAFYIAQANALRRERELKADTAPGPDLIIEVDITSSSLRRFPIYQAFGVDEIWRYDGRSVGFHLLRPDGYFVAQHSRSFPGLTPELLNRWIETRSAHEHKPTWIRMIREWARSLKAPASDSPNS